MNNLHRDLAPISASAWTDLEDEARRTFRRHLAGRRIVDVAGPEGLQLSAVGTGHLDAIEAQADGLIAHTRRSQPIVELRVPFTVDRRQVDDVERGAKDADWQPVKDAGRRLAYAEDRAIFEGYAQAGIPGIQGSSSNPVIALPAQVTAYPDAVSQAVSALRLAGVDGPYRLALGADAYTEVSEARDHGYPVLQHITRLVDDDIIWAPAIDGAYLLSTRGGDFALHLGQDVSIGYLSHDATTIELYFEETLTFLVYTTEASVVLSPPSGAVQEGGS